VKHRVPLPNRSVTTPRLCELVNCLSGEVGDGLWDVYFAGFGLDAPSSIGMGRRLIDA